MPIKYIPFYPEPLAGQAILNNFRRTLRYHGQDALERDLVRGMPLYEIKERETVGEKSENRIIRGECVSACAALREKGKKVDLVYIDPPFASGADYAKKIYIRQNPKLAETASAAEQQIESGDLQAFEEKMYGDVWDKEKYLNWMYENLVAIKSVMSDTASIFVHLDWHVVHYVKVLMDEIFGEENFVNEIIWQRTDPHNDAKNRLGRVHDTIFWYCISDTPLYNWNSVVEPLSDAALKEYSLVKMPDGSVQNYEEGKKYPIGARRFKLNDCTWKGQSAALRFEWRGTVPSDKRVWPYNTPQEMDEAVKRGEFYLRNPQKGAARCRVSYLDERDGQILQSIWTDCGRMKGGSSYPTEKPVALLDRIIRMSSNKGMLVADFFGGSGVTAAVAARLGRHFIHVDIGENSIETARDRLKKAGASFSVWEVQDGVSLYRNPVQTMDKIKELIPGLKNEDAVPEFWEGAIEDSRYGLVPVYVPNLMDSTTKLLTPDLMNRILREGLPDLPPSTKKVVVYYIDIEDEKAIRKLIDDEDMSLVKVELRDLKPLLDDVVALDEADYQVTRGREELLYKVTIRSFTSDRVLQKIDAFNQKAFAQSDAKKKPYHPIVISDAGLETIESVSLDCETAEESAPWHASEEIRIDKLGYVEQNGVKTDHFWDGTIQSTTRPLRLKIRNICGDESIYVLDAPEEEA